MKNELSQRVSRGLLSGQITLHQLHVFHATARHANLTRAAEELSLTQPTVSMQIKQVTKAIGLPLYELIGKRFYLTEAGEEVFKTCEAIFEQLNRLEENLAELKGLQQGKLRLAAAMTAKYFFPTLLYPFCQQYPSVQVALELATPDEVLARLDQNLDDFYIVNRLPERQNIQVQPLLCSPLVVVAAANHPLVGQPQISLQRISAEEFVLREPGAAPRDAAEQLFREHHLSIRAKLELGSNEAIKQVVRDGLGLGILSLHSLTSESTDALAILDVEGFPLHQQWYVITHADKQLAAPARTFLNYVIQESQHYCSIPASLQCSTDPLYMAQFKAKASQPERGVSLT